MRSVRLELLRIPADTLDMRDSATERLCGDDEILDKPLKTLDLLSLALELGGLMVNLLAVAGIAGELLDAGDDLRVQLVLVR